MKKVIILSLMIVSALSVDAQRKRTRTATSQGNVAVRFGMGVNTNKVDPDLERETTTTTINFEPTVGYMVIDNLELGVNFGIRNSMMKDVQRLTPSLFEIDTKSTDVNFGIYIQKYMPLNNWFAFTTSADLGLSTGTFEQDSLNGSISHPISYATGNTSGVGGAINFGLSFTPYNAFALEANIAGLGIQTTKWDPNGVNDITNTTDFGFNVHRQSANLAFVWYFGRGLWKK